MIDKEYNLFEDVGTTKAIIALALLVLLFPVWFPISLVHSAVLLYTTKK
jgi:hypothetical protein